MRVFAAALMAMMCLTFPALAQDEDEIAQAIDFAMHDAAFTMYHEIGHMLVSELNLPVLGKEEDAADALAVIMLLNDDSDENSYNALIDAADGWYFNAVKSTGSTIEDFSFYDEHSLDIQRAYAMVCMMVGKEPDYFSEVADAYEFSEDRRVGCGYTYRQAKAAWDALLKPHAVRSTQGKPIEVIFEDAGDYSDFSQILKGRQVLEHAADLVMEKYVLPAPVTFVATQCGSANAFYDPSERQVTYCYELANDLFSLYVNDILGYGEEQSADDEEEESAGNFLSNAVPIQ
ncbi:DUF4344 domain-containing metallopeptidase [Devosia rhizoryzae]|uniref:Metallopeptidase n=1 Tax=Devosia rhizoryzae TaxID=2774137 RepID=A0ABX7C9P4_9HYPH|nr:DUF4344 domain-containing metallopeptidase [Devosia rhizoryzae]QQR41017.1 hypothetical protein JI748_08605 [Devosia rhizoryzae]